MRPLSLSMAGFTAFRSATTIDFDGVDLFVLTGPTGSGKSSVIDAMCFALYGSVPRLGRIAPVVSLGRNEARVRFVFEVGGSTYTVTRLVVRQGDGASQRDVRLEGPDVVVSGVREVDEKIEAILGLGFEHFTRCVVLPQGRFASFLEDKPSDRDKLIKQLLDLGVFEDMRRLAGSRVSELKGRESVIDAQLHDLTVDETQISEAGQRRRRLDSFLERVNTIQKEVAARETELAATLERRTSATRHIRLLEQVEPPSGLDDLASVVRRADEAARATLEAERTAESRLEALRNERRALGEVAAFDAAIAAHRRLAELSGRVERGAAMVDETAKQRSGRSAAAESAAADHRRAMDSRRAVEQAHAAHAIRRTLEPGDDCPVCGRQVESLPDEPDIPVAADAAEEERRAAEMVEERARELRDTETELARRSALLDQLRQEVTEAADAVAELDGPDDLEVRRERAVTLDRVIGEASADVARLREARAAADGAREEAERRAETVATALDRTRDTVAALAPPAPTRSDPIADWKAFLSWCDEALESVRARAYTAGEEVASIRALIEASHMTLASEAAELAIDGSEEGVRDAVVGEMSALDTRLERMRADLAKKERLQAEVAIVRTDRDRYHRTETSLKSNRFQQWLIEEAMVSLVEFANEQLVELAAGAYSLVYESSEFLVVDHRNADATRSVRTLSGGETFLVSLALALALAERLVATSQVGTARIESMFLDEGFGTLDAETLETVAAVVTELGSRDRMVGLVTHVRELAEQIPTRFEVRKLPTGAVVDRVDE